MQISSKTILFNLFILFANFKGSDKLDVVLEKTLEATTDIENGYYKAVFTTRSFSGDVHEFEVIDIFFKKDTSDVLGGQLIFDIDSLKRFFLYDMKHLYMIEHDIKEVTSYDTQKYGVGLIAQSSMSDYLFDDILKPDFNKRNRRGESVSLELGRDTVVQNKDCFRINYFYEDDILNNLKKRKEELYIEKSTYIPLGSLYEDYYFDSYGYEKLEILDSDFNNKKYTDYFDDYKIPEEYVVKVHIPE